MLLVLWLCSAACMAAAVALAGLLGRPERLVLAGAGAVFFASALLSPSSYVNDPIWHFLNARAALREPIRLLSTWDRPAFMLLYAAPAQLGITAARLMSIAPAAVAMAATMLAARALPVGKPWLVGILVAAQLDFFGQASSTMTELLFAAGFAVAIWGFASKAPWLAAAGIGALSVARPEGPLFALLGVVALLIRHRRLVPALVALAPFAAFLVAGAVVFRDVLWYLHENAYLDAREGVRVRLEWRQLGESFFYTAMKGSQPAVLLGLETLGAMAALRRNGKRLLFLLAPLAVSWLLLTFLRIGEADWWRQSRYLVTMAPALGLIAAAGLAWALEAFPVAAPAAVLLGAGASAAATILTARRLPVGWGAPAVLAVFGLLLAVACLCWIARRRVPLLASFTALLALPLLVAPPGFFGRHLPGPAERLDLAAVRWLSGRTPAPPALGYDTPALRTVCLFEIGDPCPLPLRLVSLSDARSGTLFVTQFSERTPEPPPAGWRLVWSGEDGNIRGSWLHPRWAPVHAVIWEKK